MIRQLLSEFGRGSKNGVQVGPTRKTNRLSGDSFLLAYLGGNNDDELARIEQVMIVRNSLLVEKNSYLGLVLTVKFAWHFSPPAQQKIYL